MSGLSNSLGPLLWASIIRHVGRILFLRLRPRVVRESPQQVIPVTSRIHYTALLFALRRVQSAIPRMESLPRLRRCCWSAARRIPRRTGPYVLNMQDGLGKPNLCRHLVAALLHGVVFSEVQYGLE